jgi:hypothetical protein
VVKVPVRDYESFRTKTVFGIARGIGRLDTIIKEQFFIDNKGRPSYFSCPS